MKDLQTIRQTLDQLACDSNEFSLENGQTIATYCIALEENADRPYATFFTEKEYEAGITEDDIEEVKDLLYSEYNYINIPCEHARLCEICANLVDEGEQYWELDSNACIIMQEYHTTEGQVGEWNVHPSFKWDELNDLFIEKLDKTLIEAVQELAPDLIERHSTPKDPSGGCLKFYTTSDLQELYEAANEIYTRHFVSHK